MKFVFKIFYFMVTIRIADKKDAELIAELSQQTFIETFASSNSKENMDKFLQESFSKEALINEVGAFGNIFLLAYEIEKPIGYVRLREDNNPEKYTCSIRKNQNLDKGWCFSRKGNCRY